MVSVAIKFEMDEVATFVFLFCRATLNGVLPAMIGKKVRSQLQTETIIKRQLIKKKTFKW